jgi:hypothetical protein
MAVRLCRPCTYAIIYPEKVLRNDDRVVPIIHATNQFALDG